MSEFTSIESVTNGIKNKLNSNNNRNNLSILYAFNSTGKTRMSTIIQNGYEEDEVLCYNAFTEDLFWWDNEKFVFKVHPKSWIVNFINEQGLENDIIDNYKELVNTKVEPNFNLKNGEIIFYNATGDEDAEKNIKISRAEESIFIWSIFYTILVTAIDNLNSNDEDRTTGYFNKLKYIIIDDPVSSIDDSKIILMAIKLCEILNTYKNNNLSILITTHHALFYNVLFNTFKRDKNLNYKFIPLILMKDNKVYELKEQKKDTPFGYHLTLIDNIKKDIKNNTLQKYHFNLFRSLLEKTSNFLGYSNWSDCVGGNNKQEFLRTVNLYSHSRLSDMEYNELTEHDKEIFIETFNTFIDDFKWGQRDE